jgi:predicted dehydrogenase
VNTIVVGCGLISARWIRTLAADPRITITALIDPDPQAAATAGDSCGLTGVPWFPALEAALTVAGAGIAVNLTPADAHTRHTRTALEHGLHVFTEKPLALDLDQAQGLVQLAQSRGLTLAVMSNRGHDARFLAFAGLVRALGPGPFTASQDMFIRLPAAGFRSRLRFPALQDLAVHAFDQVRQIIPATPAQITCTEAPIPLPGGHCTTATATVHFTDGSVFTFRGGFSGPGHQTSADGHWRIDLPGAGCRWDGQDTVLTLQDTGSASCSLPPPDGHGPRITAMIDAVHGGTALPDGIGSIALLDAALRSARTGEPATVRQT